MYNIYNLFEGTIILEEKTIKLLKNEKYVCRASL